MSIYLAFFGALSNIYIINTTLLEEDDMTKISTIAQADTEQYITIVAPSIAEVMQRFRDSGLAARGYAIAGPVARHTFSYAGSDGDEQPFGDSPMTAATFIRPTA